MSFYSGLVVDMLHFWQDIHFHHPDKLRSHVLHITTTWPYIYIVVLLYVLLAFQKFTIGLQKTTSCFKPPARIACRRTRTKGARRLERAASLERCHQPCRRPYWLLWHQKGQICVCFEITYLNCYMPLRWHDTWEIQITAFLPNMIGVGDTQIAWLLIEFPCLVRAVPWVSLCPWMKNFEDTSSITEWRFYYFM